MSQVRQPGLWMRALDQSTDIPLVRRDIMGRILVHEFISLDGVNESPSWTMGYPFDPKMGEAIAKLTSPSQAILLGRNTYEMFEPAWSTRTAEDDPGAPFFNETREVRRQLDARERRLEQLDDSRALRGGHDPRVQGWEPTATSTSAAAPSCWCAGCSRTGWSTSCICSCFRSPSGRASACSARGPRPSSRSSTPSSTRAASCTSRTARPPGLDDSRVGERPAPAPHPGAPSQRVSIPELNPERHKHMPGPARYAGGSRRAGAGGRARSASRTMPRHHTVSSVT